MKNAGFDFEVVPANIEEKYPSDLPIDKVPVFLAELKANSVFESYPNNLLIAADTIVILNNEIIGKPKNEIDAVKMLKKLSGNVHTVISGCCVLLGDEVVTFSDTSFVSFRELEDDEILYYVENFQPLDKAGAYGIQEWIGMVGIDKIEGSFYNVMGLPIHKLYKAILMLQKGESI